MNYLGWAYFKKFYLIINNKEGKIKLQDLSWGGMSGAQNARRGSLLYVYYVIETGLCIHLWTSGCSDRD